VVACVVLHNNCIKNGDNNPPDDLAITHGRQIYEEVPTPDQNQVIGLQANAVRTALINNYFAHQNYCKLYEVHNFLIIPCWIREI
jgi:hypothetical protein